MISYVRIKVERNINERRFDASVQFFQLFYLGSIANRFAIGIGIKMKRTIIRKHVFMILFRVEFHNLSEFKQQEKLYLDKIDNITESERDYITERTSKIIEVLEEIDAKLVEISKGWKIERLGKVELAILRLGIYEMSYDSDIPTNVALNEAVELSKTYGGDTTPSFVNGVLGKLIEE